MKNEVVRFIGQEGCQCEILICKVYSKEKFLAAEPALIGVIGEAEFYEHPHLGDESPLVCIIKDRCFLSCFYDMPDNLELAAEEYNNDVY